MIKRLAITAAALAAFCSAIPASADDVGIAVGPGGVTVGTSNHDRYRDRDREVIRERDRRDRDETVVIKKHGDRDYDDDRKTVIIDRDRR
jgi:hypothetical protein